jgi:hypothetical protein
MPRNQRLLEWTERVENLCTLIVKRPELTWLWEVRIKILMYLIHRYGDSEPEPTPPSVAVRRRPGSFVESPPSHHHAACPATRRTKIHALLQNIHRVNCASKTRTAC